MPNFPAMRNLPEMPNFDPEALEAVLQAIDVLMRDNQFALSAPRKVAVLEAIKTHVDTWIKDTC